MPKNIGELTLYSVDDLHEMLGISKMTLRKYLREGRIRGRKLGVSWYVTEDAMREYFEEPPQESSPGKEKKNKDYRYIVQGINDLVSETEECESISEVIEVLSSQAIISLFQVRVVDKETNEIQEIVKGREFLERHA